MNLRERAALRLADVEYAAAWRLVGAAPPGLAIGAFRLGAELAARRGGAGARRLRANLARVVPDAPPAQLDRLVRAGLRSYARYWCETFRLPRMDRQAIYRSMNSQLSGADPVHAALGAGRGVVFALPHSGNWDAAGVWLVETLRRLGREPSFTTVAQRLRPDSLYRRFVAYRAALGFEVVAAEDGRATHRALTHRLRSGGVVCLLADRDLSGSGVEVGLFGEPARFPPGPARLAELTGALLVPAFPGFTPGGWSVRMAAPVSVAGRRDVPAATQAVADAFAELIAAQPEDWHALQPIWSADHARSVP
ncbi:MAG TPA: phosphatidylinositol mannoside acyltransferase [Pseudonocardia sp.]|nr:phosphatidylinositol mannoside acyltransferase [Pseudonocardia sp.]